MAAAAAAAAISAYYRRAVHDGAIAANPCPFRPARARHRGWRAQPHGLRATIVTLALDSGMPLRDVQDSARHADPRTTRRYDRDRHSLNRHAALRLAELGDR